MRKFILDEINRLEGYKTAIKSLHWNSKNLSQHKLCDDIATAISDFQDKISEVEQSISGKLPLNLLKGKPYKVKSLAEFMEDVLATTTRFYNKLKRRNDSYIGMRSDCESFISDFQRLKYLVDFTLKESLFRRTKNTLTEARINEDQTDYVIRDGINEYHMNASELSALISESVQRAMRKNRIR